MSQKTETYVAVRDGADLVKMTEKRFENAVKEAHAKNTAAREGEALVDTPERVFSQTFSKPEADTLEEAQKICTDINVLLTYFNRGLGLRCEKEISDLITDTAFVPVDGIWDLTEVVGRLPERTRTKKALSTEDMLSHIKGLPKEQREALLNEFMAVLAAD